MESGYRLIFIGNGLYNEIEIPTGMDNVGVGTVSGSMARFSTAVFHQDFLALFSGKNPGWHLRCEFGVYLKKDGKACQEADYRETDQAVICSCLNHKELFKIICQPDYQNSSTSFDSCIDLTNLERLTLGSAFGYNVYFQDSRLKNETFSLEKEGNHLRLVVRETAHGIYVNGIRTIGITKIEKCDFIFCGPYSIFYSGDSLYFNHSDSIRFAEGLAHSVKESCSSLVYPKFNRNTRIREVLSEESIQILDPPDIPKKSSDNLFMTLFPSISMLVLTIVLRGVMGNNMGMYMAFSVCSMGLGVVTSIMNYRKAKETYRKSLQERIDTYEDYISRKRKELEDARKNETAGLMRIYPDSGVTMERARTFSGDLFDRTPGDDDFLHIRLGMGCRKALREISYKPRESLVLGDEIQLLPEKTAEEYKNLQSAPIVVDLKKAGILGVVGSADQTDRFLRVLAEDLCSRQFSDDMAAFAICTEDQERRHDWMRFLPHFQKKTGLIRNIACDEQSCEIQFEYLFKTLSLRESMPKDTIFSTIVVFVLNQMGLYSHPLSQYLRTARNYGVYFIFLAEKREELPLYCGNIVLLQDAFRGTLIQTDDKSCTLEFVHDSISNDQMRSFSEKLAPVYCEGVSVESSLPKSFSLFALLGIRGADDLDLSYRWSHSDSTKSMAAPMGLKSGNEVVTLDLHEKYHGPHGLVAGTTGSGKSELLQTYILSMATLFPPDEVGFVIIDFKGGGMANLFSELPHLVGAITDIDGKALNRSLRSIRAELDKRKRLFAGAEVNNITDYIRKHKNGEACASQPLPHLILIIDEFAELKADQPDFMKEVISASRVGRSLGIHLILATQKPSGVIDDQIWSNSRFHLCLKVQSKSDSNEVLKSPLAAEIREPGRAYLQVGNNEIFDLFQSAYSGSPAQSEEMDHVLPYSLFEVDPCGRQKMVFKRKTGKADSDNSVHVKNQLEAITEKIASYCKQNGIHSVPSICMPPLPEILEYPDETEGESGEKGQVIADLGIYDDPSTQSQNLYSVDLASNNLLVIGASQSGKSNLLSVIVRNLGDKYGPKDLNIYIVDFGPSVLSNFSALPHVGGVVHDSEEEKLKNLFKLLGTETIRRRQKLLDANMSSWSAYRNAGFRDLPLILVMVDNFTALKELYLTTEDPFLTFCRSGLTVGISIVAASQNLQGIGFRYLASFSRRIAFHCNDSMDYSMVIDRCHLYPDAVPGRSVVAIDKEVYEMQVYSSFSGSTEQEKVNNQISYIRNMEKIAGSFRAKQIPMVPYELKLSMIETEPVKTRWKPMVLGMEYENITPVCLNLSEGCAYGIVGKETKESRAVLGCVLTGLQKQIPGTELYVVDSSRHELADLEDYRGTTDYSCEEDYFSDLISRIYDRVKDRFEDWKERGDRALGREPLLAVIVNGNDPIYAMCKDDKISKKYMEIVEKYYDMGVFFLYVNLENADVSNYNGPDVLKHLKETKKILYFGSLGDLKMIQVSYGSARTLGQRQKMDGYFFPQGEPIRFHVALPK